MTKTGLSPIAESLIAELASAGPLKARDIAARLKEPLQDVNRTLYGELKQHVRRDSSYRWSATVATGGTSRRQGTTARPTSGASVSPKQPEGIPVVSATSIADVANARRLRLALQRICDETRPDLSLSHVLMLMRIAEAGDEGVESSQLAADVGVSAASVSRTMRAFGKVHYCKKHLGFDLVEIGFDPLDNRRRLARLTPEGRLLVRRVLEAIE